MQAFDLRTMLPLPAEKPKSRAQREREAAAYWDSLTPAQEAWALRKMGFFNMGSPTGDTRSGKRSGSTSTIEPPRHSDF